ncbi:hypothetical protein ARMSODRAFT_844066, partial [Armillaria solidipes]
LHHLPVLPTEDTLSYYVVYMCAHIKPDSVDSYLSGICNRLENFFPNIRTIRTSMLVSRTLKGCKRLRGSEVHRKLPLSRDDIRRAIATLRPSLDHDDKLFLTLLVTGFNGLLRLAELSMPDTKKLRNWRKITRRSTVEWVPLGYSFLLPAHKADVTFEGNRIIIPASDDASINPSPIFHNYLVSRDERFPVHPGLWVTSAGKTPTRSWFIRRLRRLFPSRRIAGQSMRAGGATALASDGVLPHLIQ